MIKSQCLGMFFFLQRENVFVSPKVSLTARQLLTDCSQQVMSQSRLGEMQRFGGLDLNLSPANMQPPIRKAMFRPILVDSDIKWRDVSEFA